MKKLVCVFLSLLLCCSCFTVAFADDDFDIENGILYNYNGDDDRVTVPDGVTKLAEYCFGDKTMTELSLPDSLEVIDDFALSWCENLKTVTIPKNVRQLGCYVFEGCLSLTAIRVAEGNQFFKSVDGVLFDKSGEKLIRFPSAKKATDYRIPDTVKIIDDGAFFQNSLTEITVGDGVGTVGSWSFAKSHDLTGITLGKNVKSLGGYVFSTCEKLQSVTLPASVDDLGEFVFDYCTALQAIHVEEDNKTYASQDGVLYTKKTDALIKYPEGKSADGFALPSTVKTLVTGAFTRCDFTEIDLSGVAEIPNYALYECQSLRSVSLGTGLTRVGVGAFGFDAMLRDVYYEGSSADWKKIEIQSNNDPLLDAQKHFAGGVVFPEARNAEVNALAEGEEIPEIDTSAFSFHVGRDGGSTTGTWRYAFGQAFAFDSYFTLVTGPRSGEFLINFLTDNADDAYRFTIEPWSAYRLTYTYGYSDAGSGYTDNETVEWFCENGSSGTLPVSATGGSLRKGSLSDVTLLRQDAPPPHEHDWGKPVYTWSADNGSVTASRVCRTDATHIETETVDTTSAVVSPTCTEDGKTTYTAAFDNPAFAAQTKDAPIPATGHDWGEPTYTWSADNGSVTASRVCKTDAAHMETETVNTTAAVIPAAGTEAGKTVYTAVFANAAFAAQTKEIPLAPVRQPGDVDGDGGVSSADARLALRASVGLEQYEKGSAAFAAADVDGSGRIQSDDARYILRASVGLEDLSKLKKTI